VNARKTPWVGDRALEALRDVDELYATKGKQVIHVNLRTSPPDRTELLGLLLGPSGNLRAPTIRKGRTLIVGFDEATYAAVVK
jgi:arsenate reductase-like glutaredoxin family protein